jgi:hypothetical protein
VTAKVEPGLCSSRVASARGRAADVDATGAQGTFGDAGGADRHLEELARDQRADLGVVIVGNAGAMTRRPSGQPELGVPGAARAPRLPGCLGGLGCLCRLGRAIEPGPGGVGRVEVDQGPPVGRTAGEAAQARGELSDRGRARADGATVRVILTAHRDIGDDVDVHGSPSCAGRGPHARQGAAPKRQDQGRRGRRAESGVSDSDTKDTARWPRGRTPRGRERRSALA